MGGEGERGNCVPFKKRKKTRGNSDNLLLLSEDVLIEILLCLPVISLLRFKSVCKSWLSIIESSFFINLHAATTTKSGGGGSSFFFKKKGDEHQEEKKIGDEHQEKEKICRVSGDEFEVFEDLGRPPLIDLGEKELEKLKRTSRGRVTFNVVGCSNGIICLHNRYTRNIVLWNPAIKQSSRLLPKPSNSLGNPNWFADDDGYCIEDVVAFGVDAKTKDYKVILITTIEPKETYFEHSYNTDLDEQQRLMHSHSPRPRRRVHVYNLSTDSWRCIDITLSDAHPDLQIDMSVTQGVYLNGSLFFMTFCLIKVQEYFCTRPLILSFDLTEEIFKTIPPPYDRWNKFSRNCETVRNYIIPLGEKLALVQAFQFHCECNVWVLNEQQHSGVKESWTKLYTLGYPNYKSPIHELQCIANNGQFAIIYWSHRTDHVRVKTLQIMNLITGETKDLKSDFQGLQLVACGVGIYRPSLVQISRSRYYLVQQQMRSVNKPVKFWCKSIIVLFSLVIH